MSIRKLGIGGFVTVLWVMVMGVLALPALADTAPVVTIKAPTGATATTVKVSGTVNPNGGPSATTWDFQYSKDPETEGWTPAAGVTVSGEFAGAEAELKVPQPVGGTIEGLQPNSTYQLRLVATNEGGETASAEPNPTFETLVSKPSIDSETTSGVTSTAATLEAQVNPNNEATMSIVFEYGTSKTLAGATTLKDETPLENYGDQTATVPQVTGLTAGASYYYRVIATNATGTETGAIKEFATLPVPKTNAASAIGTTTATFNGTLTPLNALVPTEFYFQYNLSSPVAEPLTEPTPPCTNESRTEEPSETAVTGTVSKAVSGLQPYHEYTVCLVSLNAFGSVEDPISPPITFKTLPLPPEVTTEASTEVTASGAVFTASINPNNQETSYAVEYATGEAELGTAGATVVNATTPLAAGFGGQPVSVSAPALQPRTQYFYRVVATNATAEKTDGTTGEFTTLAGPLVTTGEATGITRTTAILSGTVNPGGVRTTYHFIYVPAADYLQGAGECPPGKACAYERPGSKTTPESGEVGSDYTVHPAGPEEVQELAAGTTYDYALVATNPEGTTVGPNMSFTTSPATVPLVSTGGASEVGQFSATLTGTVDTRGLATTSEFEVSATPTPGSGYLQSATPVVGSEAGTSVAVTFSYAGDLQPGTTYYYRLLASNIDGSGAGAWQSFTTSAVPGAFTLPAGLAFVPYTPVSALTVSETPAGKTTTTGSPKPLTKAQKLKKALRACHAERGARRGKCEAAAHKRYGPAKKNNSKKGRK